MFTVHGRIIENVSRETFLKSVKIKHRKKNEKKAIIDVKHTNRI